MIPELTTVRFDRENRNQGENRDARGLRPYKSAIEDVPGATGAARKLRNFPFTAVETRLGMLLKGIFAIFDFIHELRLICLNYRGSGEINTGSTSSRETAVERAVVDRFAQPRTAVARETRTYLINRLHPACSPA